MNRSRSNKPKIHRKLRRLVSRIGRDLRRNTSRSQRSIGQAAESIQLSADKRMEEALKRQAKKNKADNAAKQSQTMRISRNQDTLNTFFHSATKTFVQSQKQYESLVSILSSQPQAAEQLAEEGSEDIKGLFTTLSSMLGRRPSEPSESKAPPQSEAD